MNIIQAGEVKLKEKKVCTECDFCDCVFEYNEEDIVKTPGNYYVKCPTCGNHIHLRADGLPEFENLNPILDSSEVLKANTEVEENEIEVEVNSKTKTNAKEVDDTPLSPDEIISGIIVFGVLFVGFLIIVLKILG